MEIVNKSGIRFVFVLLMILVQGVVAQDAVPQYVKKSVVYPHKVWISPSVNEAHHARLNDVFLHEVKKTITMVRFDTIQLDKQVLVPFFDDIESKRIIDIDQAATALTTFLSEDIQRKINSPSYRKRRAKDIQDEGQVTFAETKGKSTSYTDRELTRLMNSSYIYVPYIVEAKERDNGRQREITAGLLWYKIAIDTNNTVSIMPMTQLIVTRWLSIDKDIPLADAIIKTDNAILKGITKELAVKTKKIPDFSLKARVTNVSGRQYTLSLKKSDGASLDDLYFLMENVELKGQEKEKKVGVLRIKKASRSINTVTAYQHLGRRRDLGGWVIESPRFGMQVGLSAFFSHGFNLNPDHFIRYYDNNDEIKHVRLYQGGIHSMTGVRLNMDYNFGRHIGVSQLFFAIDLSAAQINARRADTTDGVPVFLSIYSRLSKKFWWRNHGLRLDAAYGQDYIQVAFVDVLDSKYTVSAKGIHYGLGYEYMINSRVSVMLTVLKKVGLSADLVEYQVGDTKKTHTNADARALYPDFDLSGMEYQIGFKFDF